MSSLKLKLIALNMVALFIAAPNPAYGQDCVCGDLNGDFVHDLADLAPLIDHLLGVPIQVDTFCAAIDGDGDVTLNDLMFFWDDFFINPTSPLFCDTSWTPDYPISTVDTIFFPGVVEINVGRSVVDLPVFASYGQNTSFAGAYLPLRSLGTGSDNLFSMTNIRGGGIFASGFLLGSKIDIAGDTSVFIYLKDDPTGAVEQIEQIASLEYTRVQAGLSNIVPEIVTSVSGRRFAISNPRANGGRFIPQVPQVKTYIPSPCCSAGAGNVDCDPNDITDIADLTMLIDHLFINFFPLCCNSEANIDLDTDVTVDISDLTVLIDHLFISFPPLASCQRPFLDD